MKSKIQTYNSGVVSIYAVANAANPGDMPQEGLIPKISNLRYDERTVGMSRFWTAMQENARIDLVIRTPQIRTISIHDVAAINGEQYDIKQIQYPREVEPPSMDLSLEKLAVKYEFGGVR